MKLVNDLIKAKCPGQEALYSQMHSHLLEGCSSSLCLLRVILTDEFINVPVQDLGRVFAFDVGAANRASGILPLPLFKTISAVSVATVKSS